MCRNSNLGEVVMATRILVSRKIGDFVWEVKLEGEIIKCYRTFPGNPPEQVAPVILPTTELQSAYRNAVLPV